MPIFPRKLKQFIKWYKKAAVKKQTKEKMLLAEFERLNNEDIERIIEIIKKYGQPIHKMRVTKIEQNYANGDLKGDDIVELQDLAAANMQYFRQQSSEETGTSKVSNEKTDPCEN